MPNGEKKTHPAYGVVVLSKPSGGKRKLFGSSLSRHGSWIRLTVHRAAVEHDLGRDWFYEKGPALVDISMSHVQFSELITTPGVMPGVPCTIEAVGGERQPDIPTEDEIEVEKIYKAFQKDMSALVGKLEETTRQVDAILGKKGGLTKSDREEIRSLHFELTRVIQDSAPFAVKSFAKAAEKAASTAKAEVDAHVMCLAETTGLEQLRRLALGGEFGEVLELESPDGED